MQFPESWLRSFCNPSLTSQQLADTLTMAGLEVEEAAPVAPPFTGVVVGRIVAAEQHPNADRLRVCQVDVGQLQPLSIVCGAPNARVGLVVPCATVGAVLPAGADGKPFHIRLGKLRGVESQGMLCSAKELQLLESGLGDEGLLELPHDAAVGRDIREQLALDDTLFTLKLTPNLAHCLSVYGVARELSALTGAPLLLPQFPAVAVGIQDRLPVTVQASDLCGRFSGRIVRGVNTRVTTPAWMVERLVRCGQRSVSPLVDISNYVMFEFGRPSHIFDLDKLHGGLCVRWGRGGEQLKLLNGNTVVVDALVGVIADDQSVESLAGIMGGDATAVSDDTTHIYIEAAFWWPQAIAGRSRRFNFSTEAGHRFERGVDPSTTVQHVERITQLVLDICGGQAGPVDDQVLALPESQPVTLRVARAAKVIGMPLSAEQCAGALRRLGLDVQQSNAAGQHTLTVVPPPFRFDLKIEEDLIEEVARIIGYEQLPQTPPLATMVPKLRAEAQRGPFAVRRQLAQLGYQETINFSFVDASWERDLAGNLDPVKLLNPIASHMGVMRSSLLGSLLEVLKFNLDRKNDRVRVFELGRVFLKDVSVPHGESTVAGFHQPMRVAGLASGTVDALQWGTAERPVDFFDAKGDVEALMAPRQPEFRPGQHPAMHPGRCASVWLDGACIGHVGELHPRWRQSHGLVRAPALFELDLASVQKRDVPHFKPVSRFHPVERDLAVVVKESVSHDAVLNAVCLGAGASLLQALLFDVYRPNSKQLASAGALAADEKSLAVRLIFSNADATLTDDEVARALQGALAALQERTGASLRA